MFNCLGQHTPKALLLRMLLIKLENREYGRKIRMFRVLTHRLLLLTILFLTLYIYDWATCKWCSSDNDRQYIWRRLIYICHSKEGKNWLFLLPNYYIRNGDWRRSTTHFPDSALKENHPAPAANLSSLQIRPIRTRAAPKTGRVRQRQKSEVLTSIPVKAEQAVKSKYPNIIVFPVLLFSVRWKIQWLTNGRLNSLQSVPTLGNEGVGYFCGEC